MKNSLDVRGSWQGHMQNGIVVHSRQGVLQGIIILNSYVLYSKIMITFNIVYNV